MCSLSLQCTSHICIPETAAEPSSARIKYVMAPTACPWGLVMALRIFISKQNHAGDCSGCVSQKEIGMVGEKQSVWMSLAAPTPLMGHLNLGHLLPPSAFAGFSSPKALAHIALPYANFTTTICFESCLPLQNSPTSSQAILHVQVFPSFALIFC